VAAGIAAAAVAGCGRHDPASVAREWVKALEDEEWRHACDLLDSPEAGCVSSFRKTFRGRRLRFLPAGGYLNGVEQTDNRTHFALMTNDGITTDFHVLDDERIRIGATVIPYNVDVD
jgi:hypothetical protein